MLASCFPACTRSGEADAEPERAPPGPMDASTQPTPAQAAPRPGSKDAPSPAPKAGPRASRPRAGGRGGPKTTLTQSRQPRPGCKWERDGRGGCGPRDAGGDRASRSGPGGAPGRRGHGGAVGRGASPRARGGSGRSAPSGRGLRVWVGPPLRRPCAPRPETPPPEVRRKGRPRTKGSGSGLRATFTRKAGSPLVKVKHRPSIGFSTHRRGHYCP